MKWTSQMLSSLRSLHMYGLCTPQLVAKTHRTDQLHSVSHLKPFQLSMPVMIAMARLCRCEVVSGPGVTILEACWCSCA